MKHCIITASPNLSGHECVGSATQSLRTIPRPDMWRAESVCIVVLVQQLGGGCRAWDLVQGKYSTSHESFESFGFGVVTSGFGLCLHFSVFGLLTTVLGYAAFLGDLIWVYNGFRLSQQAPPQYMVLVLAFVCIFRFRVVQNWFGLCLQLWHGRWYVYIFAFRFWLNFQGLGI